MNWTTTPPATPGWYWSDILDDGIDMMRVARHQLDPSIWLAWDRDGLSMRIAAHPDALWYGPLTPPPI